jgi:peptidoglycan/xylan/chitin deacetylase (PgdA/CDA1 family)
MSAGAGKATLVLHFDVESAAALYATQDRTEARWAEWIEESLAAVASVCRVINDLAARASFFIVGELLNRAGRRYAELLAGNERFDIGNHTFSHMYIPGADCEVFREELQKTTDLIERHFGFIPSGFTAPGCFCRGLQGRPAQLKVLWDAGYRHITTDGQPGPEAGPNSPAPFTQPYSYAVVDRHGKKHHRAALQRPGLSKQFHGD